MSTCSSIERIGNSRLNTSRDIFAVTSPKKRKVGENLYYYLPEIVTVFDPPIPPTKLLKAYVQSCLQNGFKRVNWVNDLETKEAYLECICGNARRRTLEKVLLQRPEQSCRR